MVIFSGVSMNGKHPSHKTRTSLDASTYDEICEVCGATDEVPGGWGKLAEPCPGPPKPWTSLTDPQPAPLRTAVGEDVWLLVLKDMEERRRTGIEKYGVPVRADNGRDHLIDAYQEALDLCVYLRAEIERRKGS